MKGETTAIQQAMFDIKLSSELFGLPTEEEEREIAPQIFPGHDILCDRVQKTLYYGKLPSTDRPSLSLTQLAVDQFQGVGLEKLARLDMARAADMSRDAYASPTSLVLALIYLDRLKKQNPDYLKTISSADLFLVSMMVASKFLHDDGEEDEVFNDEWAKSGKLDVKEFNRLEVGFLAAIDWRVNVPTAEFESTLEKIEKEIAYRQITSRGWASYTDLYVLSQNPAVGRLWRLVTETSLKLTAVCMAAYAASLFTFLGTATLLNQTPFGPAAVASSLRTLRADRTPRADPVPEPDRTVTPADLLTASLLVTTLTAGQEDPDLQFPDPLLSGRPHGPSAFSTDPAIADYGAAAGFNESSSDRVGEGLDPPGWILERTEFIPHATGRQGRPHLTSSTNDTPIPGRGVGGVDDEARISQQWSRTVLEDILQGEGRPTASQCPLLAWGYAPLLHPARLSILV